MTLKLRAHVALQRTQGEFLEFIWYLTTTPVLGHPTASSYQTYQPPDIHMVQDLKQSKHICKIIL